MLHAYLKMALFAALLPTLAQPAHAATPMMGPAEPLFEQNRPAKAVKPAAQRPQASPQANKDNDTVDPADYEDGRHDEGPYDGQRPLEAGSQPSRKRAPRGATSDEDDPPPVRWVIEDAKAAHRSHLLSLGVGAWPTGLSTHIWYAVPLLARGFLPRVNDSFHLEFGALLLWGLGNSLTMWPAAGVRWDFYLTRNWATFFNLKMAAAILLNHNQTVQPNAVVGFGALFRVAEHLLLRMELNYPQGVTFGLAIPLGHP